jgi:hypothetical protein
VQQNRLSPTQSKIRGNFKIGGTALKIILLVLMCVLFSLNVFSQESDEAKQEIGVEVITLWRDDGNGKAGEAATSFLTSDTPIHCSVQLTSAKIVNVKMNFVAVKVAGVKPETKVVSTSYKTNGRQDRVNFTGSPEGEWVVGTYRIDIFIDGKPAGSQSFEIRKFRPKIEDKKPVQLKPDSKPRIAKRFRKN